MANLNPLKWNAKTAFAYFGAVAWMAMILGLVSEELSVFFSFILLGAFVAISFLVIPVAIYRLLSEKKK